MDLVVQLVSMALLVMIYPPSNECYGKTLPPETQKKNRIEDDDEQDMFQQYSFWDAVAHFMKETNKTMYNNNYITLAEIRVQFFISHDPDNDGRYDGLDLLYLIFHQHAFTYRYDTMSKLKLRQELNKLIRKGERAVDKELAHSDLNGDGYLDYTEFMTAMSRHDPDESAWR